MSRIFLLRHAKSSWPDTGVRDFDRPLKKRGMAAARHMGELMAARGYDPETVFCSTARRTRDTWANLAPAAGLPEERATFTDELYDSNVARYLDVLRRAGSAGSVMIIGHNPTMEDLAFTLAPDGAAAARERIAGGFKTAGLAVIRSDRPLGELAPGDGYLEAFLLPADTL